VRIDKELVAFIEVKRVATKLAAKHLRQVEMYAVNEGVEWVILTDGAVWQVYHLSGGLPVVVDLAFEADLLSDETVTQKANQLFYLTRESLSGARSTSCGGPSGPPRPSRWRTCWRPRWWPTQSARSCAAGRDRTWRSRRSSGCSPRRSCHPLW
jgi:hypothetical protein